MKITDWYGAYDNGWKGLITGESFTHPAKFSRGLIFRIVEYLLKSEMVKPGDTVIDPFGGVGLGALPCLLNGLNWIGNELEEKFVELGRKNIELWNSKFANMPRWTGRATLLQGDSRKLTEVIQQAGGLVSSPPFASVEVCQDKTFWINDGRKTPPQGQAGYGTTPGQLASLPEGKPVIVASPPFVSSLSSGKFSEEAIEELRQNGHKPGPAGNAASYGSTPGQLGAMPEGSAVISSPPFAGNSGGRGEASRNGIDPALFDRHQGAMVGGIGSAGNLAGLKPGALVTSPPFEAVLSTKEHGNEYERKRQVARGRNPDSNGAGFGDYGTTAGQLGQEQGETFWSAAAVIISQCHQLLPPRRSSGLCGQVIRARRGHSRLPRPVAGAL